MLYSKNKVLLQVFTFPGRLKVIKLLEFIHLLERNLLGGRKANSLMLLFANISLRHWVCIIWRIFVLLTCLRQWAVYFFFFLFKKNFFFFPHKLMENSSWMHFYSRLFILITPQSYSFIGSFLKLEIPFLFNIFAFLGLNMKISLKTQIRLNFKKGRILYETINFLGDVQLILLCATFMDLEEELLFFVSSRPSVN